MTATPRPYQTAAIERLRALIRSGKRRVLLVCPTGSGKTLTAAIMILSAIALGKRVLFVAHRLELIDQTCATLARLGLISIGVIRASDKRRAPAAPVQVASIQTLARRTQFDFDLVFVDEAHRSSAATYTRHVFERHKGAVIIGLTATPIRADGRPLNAHFDEIVLGATYSELIAAGFLAAPTVYSTPILPDLASVRTSGGDYNQEDLEAAMNKGALIGDLVAQWSKHPRQRTVAFAVSVAHSLAIVEQFRAAGVRAEHLDGTTPEEERRAILARLEAGTTELVSNVGVLTEGWDCPPVKTLVIARPTKSLGLYMQMAGRILRPWEGVTPLILDHGSNVDRHGLPHEDREWSLDGKPKKGGAAPLKVCKACFGYVAAGARVCPLCGEVFPASAPELAAVEPIPVDLALRTLEGDSADLARFRALAKKARERGYQIGWVAHRWTEEREAVIPASWWAALRSDAKRDKAWAEARRERRARLDAEASAQIDLAERVA